MTVKEEVKKEDLKLNEQRLTDLPVSEEQADATKGGHEKWIEITNFSLTSTEPGKRG